MRNSALWRLRPYLRPHRARMVVMTAAALAGLFAQTLIPQATKAVIDGPIASGDRSRLLPLVAVVVLLGLFEGAMASARRFTLAKVANGIEFSVRNDLYAHLQRLPVSFHDRWQSGQLLSRAMSDINVIRRFLGFGLVFLVVNTATFAWVVFLLWRLHTGLALLVAASGIPIFWASRLFEREYRAISRRLQDEGGDLATLVEESATGIRITKAFGRHGLMSDRFAAKARVVRGTALETSRLRGSFWAVLGCVPNLTMALVLLGGAIAVSRGTLTVGGLIAFNSWLLMLVWPIESLGEILSMGEEAATASERIFEVLDEEPEVADRPGARPLPTPVRGALRFEGVSFAYGGTAAPVLDGVDLDVRPGETMALVGATGSGKTTLATLVNRLHDPTAGRITIDGVDIRDVPLEDLRRHVAFAFEDPILFSASVRENVLLGAPDATEADLEEALATAQAGFAHDLPWGLDTRVGEQGLSLSGGQRQRLALARAVVTKPTVLVLDDPLSALDVHTEALVEEALRRVLQGVTAIVVAHRPSTVALADRVALLDGGRIAAIGTHAELLDTSPRYRSILSESVEASA